MGPPTSHATRPVFERAQTAPKHPPLYPVAIAVYLDGQDDPDRADDGTPPLDDDLLICANAWWEPLDFTIPTQDTAMTWALLIDTANPTTGHRSGGAGPGRPMSNGDRINVHERSLVIISGQRWPSDA